MKISKSTHVLSVIVGLIGVVLFVGIIVEGADNEVFGITKFDAFFSTAILMLTAIWLQIAAVHHMMLEKRSEIV